MKKEFLQTLQNNISFTGKSIGIAVSGGVDSVVLLNLFQVIKKKYKLKIFALHYNHKWRKDSFKDALLVKEYCKKYKITFIYKESKGTSLKNEENARNERYSFLKEAASQYKLDLLSTAHQLDDQIETILFRLARGTGPAGLLPIKQVYELDNKLKIIRPFLAVKKENIYEYALKNKLKYREDSTNKDTSYTRNLIRVEIVPHLKKINKDFEENIINCCKLIHSQNATLQEYFLNIINGLSVGRSQKMKNNEIVLPLIISRKKFFALNDYVQRSFIYWLLSCLNIPGNLRKINIVIDHIKQSEKVVLDNKCILDAGESNINFENKKDNKKEVVQPNQIAVFVLNGRNKKISLGYKKDLILRKFYSNNLDFIFPTDEDNIAFADMSDYKNKNLLVRTRDPGDVFQPLGFGKTMKLKNYLINKKIKKEKRYDLPLLCYGNEVLWIPGYSISEKIKVVKKPTHIIEVKSK